MAQQYAAKYLEFLAEATFFTAVRTKYPTTAATAMASNALVIPAAGTKDFDVIPS